MKIAIGPVPYCWKKDVLTAFYDDVAKSEADIVYLGETVCARRHEFRDEDWIKTAEKLEKAGKEVILSTPVLVESAAAELLAARLAKSRFTVEAGEMGAVSLSAGKPFVAGMHLNLYHERSVSLIVKHGAFRWVAPFELSFAQLRSIMDAVGDGIETEVLVFGPHPLAYSARCFTARRHNLQKDTCAFKCADYPEGMPVSTMDGQDVFLFNGIQTMSYKMLNLIGHVKELESAGVNVIRVSPEIRHTNDVVSLFARVLRDGLPESEAFGKMSAFFGRGFADGYFHGAPGMDYIG